MATPLPIFPNRSTLELFVPWNVPKYTSGMFLYAGKEEFFPVMASEVQPVNRISTKTTTRI